MADGHDYTIVFWITDHVCSRLERFMVMVIDLTETIWTRHARREHETCGIEYGYGIWAM